MASSERTEQEEGAEQRFVASAFAASVKPEEYFFGRQNDMQIVLAVGALQEHPDTIDDIINALSYRFRVSPSASDQQREAALSASTSFFQSLSKALGKELANKAPEKIQDKTSAAAAGAASLPTG